MAPGPNDRLEKATSSASVLDEEHQAVERTNSENKSTRHPRWTKQETLILIEGKNIAERVKEGRAADPAPSLLRVSMNPNGTLSHRTADCMG